jgi:hypothetical protein
LLFPPTKDGGLLVFAVTLFYLYAHRAISFQFD